MPSIPNDAFVHLHVHSEYSLLDGACRIRDMVQRIREMGQTAVALTDHGVMYGVMPFYQAAKAAGIHPIIGCEVYVARRTRHDREHRLDGKSYHLILLCQNRTGYQNLVKLVSLASLEGFYQKPRVDWELLKQYHEGLICLSGCLAGEIPRLLLEGSYAAAKERALQYQRLFGAENYYLELQGHGIEAQRRILPLLLRLSRETGIPVVATNDAHYLAKEDAAMQQVLLCIQTGTTVDDPNAMRFETQEFYLKSTEEMAALFREVPEAITNTGKIAARCQLEFETGALYLPRFTMEGVSDNLALFQQLCWDGLRRRYGNPPPSEAIERMNREIAVIRQMGYVDYFLIVWDYIRFARREGIPVGPGRGSGAGSICAYCMEITQVDPLRYHLLFERFLNPERVSMPDFDVDFCIEGRQRVKEYVIQKYGADHVSEIITFDLMKARAAVRDAGRAMGISYALCDKIAKSLDSRSTIAQAMQRSENEELRKLYETDLTAKKLLDMAMRLEGMPRHASTHAAGVLISAVPITDLVPLQRNDDTIVTQYPMGVLEQMGLLKFDFLGLRNLTILKNCEDAIRRYEPAFQLDKISLEDEAVYAMMSRGDTAGVFQFESAGMRRVLMRLQPRNLEDLTAVLSLYRPGPRASIEKYLENRRHPEQISYAHPLLEPILCSTYGCMIYQEQVMEICRALAGYSYGRADLVRRAMAKKKQAVMEQERQVFIYGCDGSDGSSPCCGAVANGVSPETANAIFDEIAGFAAYAFNKSHAVAYAMLSYQTAYVKCHYFRDAMAALMTSVAGEPEKLMEYLSACQPAGVRVLPPHINESFAEFSREGENLRFGLLAVKNLGKGFIADLVQERQKNGKFTSIFDFAERMLPFHLNRQTLDSLISCGALDHLGANRRQMRLHLEQVLESCREFGNRVVAGQMDLFGGGQDEGQLYEPLPQVPEYSPTELLRMEHDSLGLYLSGHPLDAAEWLAKLFHVQQAAQLREFPDGTHISLLVTLQQAKRHMTKQGDTMCFLTCEDRTGTADLVVFPKLYAAVRGKLDGEAILFAQGKISQKEESVSVLCDSILTAEELVQSFSVYRFCVKLNATDRETVQAVLQWAAQTPGKIPLCLYLTDQKRMMAVKQCAGVAVTEETIRQLFRAAPAAQPGMIRRN